MALCTSGEAERLVAKLHADFAGWPYDDDRRREFLAMCRSFVASDISAAIGLLRNAGENPDRVPAPATVAAAVQAVQAERWRAAREAERRQPWPEKTPAAIARHVAELRERHPECWSKRRRAS